MPLLRGAAGAVCVYNCTGINFEYLFNDLLRPAISHHSVYSVITAYNIIPLERDD